MRSLANIAFVLTGVLAAGLSVTSLSGCKWLNSAYYEEPNFGSTDADEELPEPADPWFSTEVAGPASTPFATTEDPNSKKPCWFLAEVAGIGNVFLSGAEVRGTGDAPDYVYVEPVGTRLVQARMISAPKAAGTWRASSFQDSPFGTVMDVDGTWRVVLYYADNLTCENVAPPTLQVDYTP